MSEAFTALASSIDHASFPTIAAAISSTATQTMQAIAVETFLQSTNDNQLTWSYSTYVLKLPFIVISIPYYVYRILTYTLTLTLDIYSFTALFATLSSIAFYLVRFKYLAKYNRLPVNPPPFIGNPFDLHPNTTLPQEKESAQEDYMDVFLASIKVFGYLDRPIFHELSRQMEIKTYEVGEVIYDEANPTRDFIVVVEGEVDLWVKRHGAPEIDDEDDTGIEGYMLLHTVKSGGAVSSLFGIISVLTDELSDDQGGIFNYSHSHLDEPEIFVITDETSNSVAVALESEANGEPIIATTKTSRKHIDIHPHIIARTSSTVTLAIIPAEAFEVLSKKHPHTAAHFAQVIITRFQRVTFSTLYRYLGLSRELLTIEKRVNETGIQIDEVSSALLNDEYELKLYCFLKVSKLIGMDSELAYSPISTSEIKDERQWAEDIVIQTIEQRDILIKEGERVDGIYYVIKGDLQAYVYDKKTERNNSLFTVGSGRLAGYVSKLTGYPSFITLSASTRVQLAFFPQAMIEKMIERCPTILLSLALRLMKNVSPLVLQIDLALEWVQVSAGQVLYRQGDAADSIHYVLSGRLRCINEPDQFESFVPKPSPRKKVRSQSFEHAFGSPVASESGSPMLGSADILILPPTYDHTFEILSEHGQNDSIGEHQVLTSENRPGTLYAIRDTELTVMSKVLFEALAALNPNITLQIARIIATKTGKNQQLPKQSYNVGLLNGVSCHDNLKSVAIIPTHGYVPVSEFADRLSRATGLLGDSFKVLNTECVMNALGKHAFTRLGRLKLISWLSEQEESARIVYYVANGGVSSPWTVRCVRQADLILFVGLGEESGLGEYEQLVMSMKTTARKELVLIYPSRNTTIRSAAWLKDRPWITMHHHISMRVVKLQRNGTIEDLKHLNLVVGEGLRSDFARLARRLLNKSIGLVLGGGGARGFAHAGIIKALDEAGIPIDMVGGTSMGAFVGGVFARENSVTGVYGRCKGFATRASSVWRSLLDMTWPHTALFYSHEFNRAIFKGTF